MKKFYVLLFSILFSVVAFAQNNDDAKPKDNSKKGPGITFSTNSHDFGVISEGTMATYEFEFKNNGDEPLVLKNVKPSCGCTTPEWPRKPIMPGDKDVIKVIYNSNGRPGTFHKSITVTTNIEENGTKVLYIKGEVKRKEEMKSPVRNDQGQ